MNGGEIGMGDVEAANTVANQNNQVTVQSTLNMEKGDQVWVQIWNTLSGEYLADDCEHRTHFTGFMLEEEIAADCGVPLRYFLEMRKMIVD